MRKRNKILLGISGLVFLTGLFFQNWLGYVIHLADHQFGAIYHRIKITREWINKEPDKEKTSLLFLENVKSFGRKIYGLPESKSFEYFVDLHRDTLGWNLTIAPEFKMEATEFSFPIAGKFGYLGFFSEKLKDKWKSEYIQKGYDVYENEIGAYSTLGYFKDPVYSTYLNFSKEELARLVLHEMAHEKLYFKNDSDFSESLASFIEIPAANLYLYKSVKTPLEIKNRHRAFFHEYMVFQDMLEDSRKKLSNLYESSMSKDEMQKKKKEILDKLYEDIQGFNFQFITSVKDIPRENLNNAFLVQNRRYTPHKENGFMGLLEECNNDFQCWFDNLKKLEPCSKEVRMEFSSQRVQLNEILKQCK